MLAAASLWLNANSPSNEAFQSDGVGARDDSDKQTPWPVSQ